MLRLETYAAPGPCSPSVQGGPCGPSVQDERRCAHAHIAAGRLVSRPTHLANGPDPAGISRCHAQPLRRTRTASERGAGKRRSKQPATNGAQNCEIKGGNSD